MITYPFGIETLDPQWWFDCSRTDRCNISGTEVINIGDVNNATLWTQSTASQRADTVLGVAGRTVFSFDRTASQAYTSNDTTNPAQSLNLTAVVSSTNTVNSEMIIYAQNDGTGVGRTDLQIRNGVADTFFGGANLTGTTVITDGKFHVLSIRYDLSGTAMRLYVDGLLEASVVRAIESATGTWVLARHKNTPNLTFDGLIAEGFMLLGNPSDIIFNAYQKALCAKWQIEYKG